MKSRSSDIFFRPRFRSVLSRRFSKGFFVSVFSAPGGGEKKDSRVGGRWLASQSEQPVGRGGLREIASESALSDTATEIRVDRIGWKAEIWYFHPLGQKRNNMLYLNRIKFLIRSPELKQIRMWFSIFRFLEKLFLFKRNSCLKSHLAYRNFIIN